MDKGRESPLTSAPCFLVPSCFHHVLPSPLSGSNITAINNIYIFNLPALYAWLATASNLLHIPSPFPFFQPPVSCRIITVLPWHIRPSTSCCQYMPLVVIMSFALRLPVLDLASGSMDYRCSPVNSLNFMQYQAWCRQMDRAIVEVSPVAKQFWDDFRMTKYFSKSILSKRKQMIRTKSIYKPTDEEDGLGC